MSIERADISKVPKASVVFFLCWLGGFVISYIRIYCNWGWPKSSHLLVFFNNQIFFYLQTALPRGFETIGDNNHEVASAPIAIILSILFWIIIGFIFAWLTRRLRLYFTIPLAVVTIFVVLIAAQLLLGIFGIEPEIIAP